jgi:hypothetical protein
MTDKFLNDATEEELRAALALFDAPSAPYTAAEVEPKLGRIGWGELEYGEHSIILRGKSVPVTHTESFGGEGQGEKRWVVVKIGDQLFKKDGYYASHYGTDWDGPFREVNQVEKTVTVYEPVA